MYLNMPEKTDVKEFQRKIYHQTVQQAAVQRKSMEDISYSEKSFKDGEDDYPVSDQTHKNNEVDTDDDKKTDDLSTNIGGPAPGQMSRKEIQESLSQILNGIELKRKQDMKIVDDVVKEIMAQAKRSCEVLEQHMLHMHTVKSKELNEELEKLVEILDNIKQAEIELDTSRDSLNSLCKEIQNSIN